jgi:two-component system response regulator CpxR
VGLWNRNCIFQETYGISTKVREMSALNNTADSRILIVDDNQDALSALSSLLQIEGFSVRTAQNGLEALNRMKPDDHISLVLLDLWMPVMDGWEFLRRKRSDPRIAEIPVVVISAVSSDPLDGVETVLGKPVHLETLLATIRRHLVSKATCA